MVLKPVPKFLDVLLAGLLTMAALVLAACRSPTPLSSPEPAAAFLAPLTPSIGQAPLALSAGQRLRFEHISVEDGLSQNAGFAILQDSDGFMWFGTEDGLNKYDGQNFTVYRHDPDDPNSLSDNWIWAIHQDHLGALWIGTLNGGLDRYDRELNQFSHYKHDPDNPQSLSHNEVLAIYQDLDGVLWIGTRGGLDRFDPETESFTNYRHDPDNPQSLSAGAVPSIYETQDGILWVGTEGGGLSRFDRETEVFAHFQNDPGDPSSLSDNSVWEIFQDQFGLLWIGTNGGLDQFDLESGQFTHYQNNPDDRHSLSHNVVRAICEDSSGALWVGTGGGGLDRFDRETETFAHFQNDPSDPHSLSHSVVYDVYQDREGVLWVGTYGGGLSRVFLRGLSFAHFNHNPNDLNSLGSDAVYGIHEDQSGTLWVGTDGGLDSLDKRTGQGRHYQHDHEDPFSLSGNFVLDVYEDQEGLLWIGTYDAGLNSFDPETGRFTRYQEDPDDPASLQSSAITDIYQDQQGILWIGTFDKGLHSFDPETERFTHYQSDPNGSDGFNSDFVLSIYEDQQGVLWVGTFSDGLIRYDREDDEFTHFEADSQGNSSLSNNLVSVILQDRKGTLWIGTAGGLNKFDPQTETFAHYREKDGLPNDMVYGILEDEQGNLWLSTNHGLSRFDPRTETFTNFDMNDGLQSNEFNSFAFHKSSSGEMFFGGINGLNTFYPDRIQENNPYIPPVALTRLAQGDEDIDLRQTINNVAQVTLNWPNAFFEFEFAALSYAHPAENHYAYMLEGFEDSWNHTGTRGYGRYTNLPGGTFTLRMIGSNNDGVWNENGASVEVTIIPPFWQRWWFRGIVLLVLVGGIIGGYRLRVRSLEARSRELETQVERRTAEIQQQVEQRVRVEAALRKSEMEKAVAAERNRLARDLHDSVTQSLYSLTLLAVAGQRMIQAEDLQQVAGNQTRLGEIAQQALQEMRLLVYELRPLALESEGLIGALEQRLETVERRAGIQARVLVEGEVELAADLEEELYRIAQEALNNALKHAGASQVVLSVRVAAGSVALEVADNGQGFDQAEMHAKGGLGLISMQERADKIGGQLTIHSAPGEGTRVGVSVGTEGGS